MEITFRPRCRHSRLTIHKPYNPTIIAQALQQRNLVHVPLDCVGVRLVKRYALDRKDLLFFRHDPIYTGRATLADEVKPDVDPLVHLVTRVSELRAVRASDIRLTMSWRWPLAKCARAGAVGVL